MTNQKYALVTADGVGDPVDPRPTPGPCGRPRPRRTDRRSRARRPAITQYWAPSSPGAVRSMANSATTTAGTAASSDFTRRRTTRPDRPEAAAREGPSRRGPVRHARDRSGDSVPGHTQEARHDHARARRCPRPRRGRSPPHGARHVAARPVRPRRHRRRPGPPRRPPVGDARPRAPPRSVHRRGHHPRARRRPRPRGARLPARWPRRDAAPALLWIHGGGLVLLDAESDEANCARRAMAVGCVIVSGRLPARSRASLPGGRA